MTGAGAADPIGVDPNALNVMNEGYGDAVEVAPALDRALLNAAGEKAENVPNADAYELVAGAPTG
jgi:hypothetical protein